MTTPNVKSFKNNQQRGKDLEKRFMNYLSRQGFWVHFMNPAPDGSQPFDIIACKDSTVYAFDCKTLDGDRFPLNRIEDNQRTAFQLMNKKGNYLTYFVIEVEKDVVKFIPSMTLEKIIREGKKSIEMRGLHSAYIGCE